MHRFGDTQTGRGDQTEQGLVARPTQARRGAKTVRRGQQVDDLLLAVDVRGQSLTDAAEGGVVRDLRAWFELLEIAGKRAQLLQPPCPGCGFVAVALVAPRPVSHHLERQRSLAA